MNTISEVKEYYENRLKELDDQKLKLESKINMLEGRRNERQ